MSEEPNNSGLLPLRPKALGDNPKQAIKSSESRLQLSSLHGQKAVGDGLDSPAGDYVESGRIAKADSTRAET